MKIELEPGVWVANFSAFGYPPRAIGEENAREFASLSEAKAVLKTYQKARPFLTAIIHAGRK